MTDETRTTDLTPEQIAELDELFGGRFPPDYVQEPISPAIDHWIRSIEADVCPICGSDCANCNPPVVDCPMGAACYSCGAPTLLRELSDPFGKSDAMRWVCPSCTQWPVAR
jgi:hypothetical protein